MQDKAHENRPSKRPHELVHGAQIWPPKITVVYICACRFIILIVSSVCICDCWGYGDIGEVGGWKGDCSEETFA